MSNKMSVDSLVEEIHECLISHGSNGGNITDAIELIAEALDNHGDSLHVANAIDQRGLHIAEALGSVANALNRIAKAMENSAGSE